MFEALPVHFTLKLTCSLALEIAEIHSLSVSLCHSIHRGFFMNHFTRRIVCKFPLQGTATCVALCLKEILFFVYIIITWRTGEALF